MALWCLPRKHNLPIKETWVWVKPQAAFGGATPPESPPAMEGGALGEASGLVYVSGRNSRRSSSWISTDSPCLCSLLWCHWKSSSFPENVPASFLKQLWRCFCGQPIKETVRKGSLFCCFGFGISEEESSVMQCVSLFALASRRFTAKLNAEVKYLCWVKNLFG